MGIKNPLVFSFLFFVVCFFNENAVAQNEFASEGELIKQAKKYFDDEEFVQAYPLYSQLLSLYPQNPEYNFRFGVCMLLTTSDKENPISYFQKAAQKPDVDNAVYYFLGKAYHLNYRFDEAISNYNTFKRSASRSQLEKYKVDMEILSCNHGKELLRNLTDLVVMDKKELEEAEFFRSYDLSGIGGKLLVKLEEFKSPVDKKKKEKSIIYLAKNNEVIYYSSYGTDGKNGRDIYYVQKLPGGEWSKPFRMADPVNTPYDEDYPFLHPNGRVLYFSSKGHNSMGGYDVFKSEYDSISGMWSPPRNLDFPISSPDDDILFVTDSLESSAYFSSARSSPAGKIMVYRINTERKPSDVIVVHGNLRKTIQDQKLEGKVTVKNAGTGEVLNVTNVNPSNGEYISNVPNGSKLIFMVEAEGFTPQSELVVMPFQNQMRPMIQEVSFDSITGKMTIRNRFDDVADESNYLIAMNYIQEKAKLEVNFTETPLSEKSVEKPEAPVTADEPVTKNIKPLSNEEIVSIAREDAREAETEYRELRKEADYALVIASEKNEQSLKKSQEAQEVLNNAATLYDPVQKQSETERGNQLKEEAESNQRSTIAAYNLARQLDQSAKDKKEEADLSAQYAKDLEASVKSGNSNEAIARLEEQQKKLESLPQKNTGAGDIYSGLKTDAEMKQKEADQTAARTLELKNEIVKLEQESESMKKEAGQATNENLKQNLLAQSEELAGDIAERTKELSENQEKESRLRKEALAMNESVQLVGEMMERIKSGEPAATDAASIDREKLEQQVTQYETSVKEQPVTVPQPVPVTPETSTTPVSETGTPKADVVFGDKLAKAGNISDEAQKEQARAQVYSEWSEAIDKEIQAERQSMDSEQDPGKKAEIENKIAILEAGKSEKLERARESEQKAESLKQTPVVQTAPEPVTTPETWPEPAPDPVVTNPVNTEAPESQPAPVKSSPVSTTKIYSNPTAIAEEGRAEALKQESAQLKSQAGSYRQQAAAALSETEKQSLVEKADQADLESQQKTLEAEKSLAMANKAEFNENNSKLDDLSALTQNDATDITVAELLREEAAVHFQQAEKERANAESVTSFELKEQSLQNAYAYERMALDKQKRAEETFMKYNPGYVYDSNSAAARKTSLPVSSPTVTTEKPIAETPERTQPTVTTEPQPTRTETEMRETPPTASTARTREELNTLASEFRQKGDEQTKESQALLETVDTIQDPDKKSETISRIKEFDREAQENYAKADSVSKAAQSAPAAVVRDQPVSATTPPVTEPGENQPARPASKPVRTVSRPGPASSPGVSAIPLESGEVFERKSAPVYSSNNPIPVDPELPEGVLFKVQIGAFRNEIRQDLFQGISPVSGERTPQGFIRYTAGIFKKFESAVSARDYVKSLGYPDAFIVAFYNGKRVPVSQARQQLGESVTGNLPLGPNVSPPSSVQPETTGPPTGSAPAPVSGTQVSPSVPSEPAKSQSVSTVEGLFYTVQVGVFSRPVSSAELSNIQPLYNDETENGNIRYYTGIYTDITTASQAKRTVIGLGILDAFVVAYYKGKRVTLSDAKLIETSQGSSVFTSAPNVNQMPIGAAPPQVPEPAPATPARQTTVPETRPVAPTSGSDQNFALPLTPPQSSDDTTVLYKVQIGAFEEYLYMYFKETPFSQEATVLDSVRVNEQVPVELANKYFSVKKYGLKSYKDANGLTVYTVGDLKTFTEAQKLKEMVIAEGIRDAFVVAYSRGKKITLKEARQRTGE